MPQFRYRALTQAGELVLGEVDAPSREEVVRLAGQISRYGRVEASGMLVMLGLMVAMHSGY